MLSLLLPVRCPVCSRATGAAPCADCWADLRRAPPRPAPPGLDTCAALLAYEGAARELIARLKYRNGRAVVPWLASALAGLVLAARLDVDAVTWTPTTTARRRARGFDQAELLARRVGREIGRPVPGLLRRSHGPPQTGRSAAERRTGGPRFVAASPAPARVLVVDDLCTTGSTLTAAAHVLRIAGARHVHGLVAGRTPLKVRTSQADV